MSTRAEAAHAAQKRAAPAHLHLSPAEKKEPLAPVRETGNGEPELILQVPRSGFQIHELKSPVRPPTTEVQELKSPEQDAAMVGQVTKYVGQVLKFPGQE
jgi:hypothetical protein